MGKYFGTDGIRGEANQGIMSVQQVTKIGQAFGAVLKSMFPEKAKVLIGKDTRVSGYMLENALAAGLCSVGVDVLFVGPLPTPGIAYLTRGMRATSGVVISASHNPFYDNGIKFFDKNGFKFPDEIESKIEALIDDESLSQHLVNPIDVGRARRIDDAIGQYAVFLKERFPKHLQLDGMRIVMDCANGAGYRVGPKVFRELGAEVFCINDEPNGFNINFESGALHPEKLQDEVLRYRADIGIALDGDADRLILVDERGGVVDGDQIIALCALELNKSNLLANQQVVVTVMSNMGLEACLKKHGIETIRTQVGDRFVVEEMRKRQLILGGEQSGHIVFLDSNTTGDSILAALKVMEVMCKSQQKLSILAGVMQHFPQITRNVKVTKKPKLESLPSFWETKCATENALGSQGRLLTRYSGTESLARITLEGPDAGQLRKMADVLETKLLEDIAKLP